MKEQLEQYLKEVIMCHQSWIPTATPQAADMHRGAIGALSLLADQFNIKFDQ